MGLDNMLLVGDRKDSRRSSKSFTILGDSFGGPRECLVVSVVLSRFLLSFSVKYLVTEQAYWKRLCALADLLLKGLTFT